MEMTEAVGAVAKREVTSVKVKQALISVSDKTGLDDFVKGLHEMGVAILSTGGTAKRIRELGIPVRDVSEYTKFPEMLDGRVKTLHPKIHGALLSLRENAEHMATAKEHGIELIDMVVVNLYPFEKTVAKPDVSLEEAIENIDIGGPSMLRSAAKNYRSVAVVTNPDQYPSILRELKKSNGSLSEQTLESLGLEVFRLTSLYDTAIYGFLTSRIGKGVEQEVASHGQTLELKYRKVQDLRYGENPHQKASFYKDPSVDEPCVSTILQHHGKELSFNNIIDLNAALEIVKEFSEPTATVIKHTNPCGTASAPSLSKAYKDALACDPVSAFGSIVGLNRSVDVQTASAITKAGFVECVIAPAYESGAMGILKQKKNLRIIEVPHFDKQPAAYEPDMKKVVGGMLVQDRDAKQITRDDLKVVTKKKPTAKQIEALLFGWKVCKHIKSNAILLCKGTKTVGVGAGQMSRVDSVIIAARKAGSERSKGSVLASDAFFPKPDGIKAAKKAGAVAIIQPGGSIQDEEIIKTADKLGIAMVFTGIRHFKH
jgi:phosphoribosylaminoimidazolecarboxamide formyltransferase/IMP cyclohydrolase